MESGLTVNSADQLLYLCSSHLLITPSSSLSSNGIFCCIKLLNYLFNELFGITARSTDLCVIRIANEPNQQTVQPENKSYWITSFPSSCWTFSGQTRWQWWRQPWRHSSCWSFSCQPRNKQPQLDELAISYVGLNSVILSLGGVILLMD